MAASWLHLLRVTPALHPPERPSHTHTPKPGFGGRGHDVVIWGVIWWISKLMYVCLYEFSSVDTAGGLYLLISVERK